MWKWDFCMFLQGTSSGSEVHKIVIEVGEYQCVALRATWCQAICRWSWSTLWISSHCPFVPGPFSFYASHLLPSSHLCLSGFEHGKLAPAVASLQHATWWMTDHQVFQNVSWKAQRSCWFNYDSSVPVPVLLGGESCDQGCTEYGLCWSFYLFPGL